MAEKKKNIKVKWQRLIPILIIGFALGFGAYYLIKNNFTLLTGYLGGNTSIIEVYDVNGQVIDGIPRGTEVKYKASKTKEIEKTMYYEITIDKKTYLVKTDNISNSIEEVVTEKIMYVRTTYHLLGDKLDGTLLNLITKGTEFEIIGYHKLMTDGTVDYYKIKVEDTIGYFPSKYMVATKDEALANYDENNTYKIHETRGNVYGGGSAKNADYYPTTKPTFENNPMPEEVQALYLNGTKNVIDNIDQYIEIAKQSNINAFVVDIKDSGVPAYQSEVMKIYSKTNYEHAKQTMDHYREGIKKLKDAGFYVIGRISAFKDEYYAMDHPEYAILETNTGKPYYLAKSYWPSAYSREVWKYNVDLAKEAVTEMGFNEIQFDYVRFPDRVVSLERQGLIDFRNTYNEDKLQAVQRFLMYATNELHQLEVYVSADVFGESAHTYVTAYGQYWPAISNVVDVISGMPYPDHFSTYEYGFKEPVWTTPYEILNYWGKNYVAKRQAETASPAIVRTWIQAYDSIKSPYVTYDADILSKEIQGLYDAGLTGGYMTWNSGSSLTKYRSQIAAFNKEYKK